MRNPVAAAGPGLGLAVRVADSDLPVGVSDGHCACHAQLEFETKFKVFESEPKNIRINR